eukprot:g45631.t1
MATVRARPVVPHKRKKTHKPRDLLMPTTRKSRALSEGRQEIQESDQATASTHKSSTSSDIGPSGELLSALDMSLLATIANSKNHTFVLQGKTLVATVEADGSLHVQYTALYPFNRALFEKNGRIWLYDTTDKAVATEMATTKQDSLESSARAGVVAGTARKASQGLLVPFAVVTANGGLIGAPGPIEILTAEEALLRSDALAGRLICPACSEFVNPVRGCTAGEQSRRRAHFRHSMSHQSVTADMERLHSAESRLHLATKLYIARHLRSAVFLHPACREQEACLPVRLRFDGAGQTALIEASLSWLQKQGYSTQYTLKAGSEILRPDVPLFADAVCLEVRAGSERASQTEAPYWARGLASTISDDQLTVFYSLCAPENRLLCNECRPFKEARKQRELLAMAMARKELQALPGKHSKRRSSNQRRRRRRRSARSVDKIMLRNACLAGTVHPAAAGNYQGNNYRTYLEGAKYYYPGHMHCLQLVDAIFTSVITREHTGVISRVLKLV